MSGLRIGDVTIGGRVLTAPMTGVTDLPFRRAASRLGAAYVSTEMVACADFARGRPDVVRRAAVGDGLPLMVVQLLGADPDAVAQGARLATAAGADLIDLNMGCPSKEVVGAACGAALMRDPDLAERVVAAAVGATRRPVTVKMRLGWDTHTACDLALRAERAGAAALTVHGRTRNQFYNGRADWDAVAAVKAAVRLPVVVNGDILDAEDAAEALRRSGADAIMLGRGVYGRPWAAAAIDAALAGGAVEEPEAEARLGVVLDHMADALSFYAEPHGLRLFRKHLGWYVERAPWPDCAHARRAAKARLCRLESAVEVERGLVELWCGESVAKAA